MKKIKKLLVAVPLALASTMAFAGCDSHTHTLKLTSAVAADCYTAGNSAYYTCETCGKHYSDEAGATEIAENSWVINQLGHLFSNAEDHDCNRGCGTIRETSSYNLWDGTVASALPAEVENVITITTAEQLAKLASLVNAGNTFEGKTIKLGTNIDLANREWTPIGYGNCDYAGRNKYGYNFSGVFDGQGYTISNFKITTFNKGAQTEGASAGVGLFGTIYMAEIKNVKVDNADVTGNHFVAALVGKGLASIVDGCTVTNSKVNCVYFNGDESGDKAGMVVGHIAKGTKTQNEATVKNCVAENCEVNADRDAGQVIGCTNNGGKSENNSAENVTVTWNQSSANVPNYTDGNKNIKNEIVGRT